MDARPQPNPTEDPKDLEAEVFAASAAEGALTDKKSPDLSDDIGSLTEAVQQSAISSGDTNSSSPESEGTDSTVTASGDSLPAPQGEDEPERPLTKEELIEEALNCPCIDSMKEGPCGNPFIEAYKCFLQSETEPKGMDCVEQFKTMQGCISEHPDEYNLDDDDESSDPFAAQSETGIDTSEQKATTASSVETAEQKAATEIPVETAKPSASDPAAASGSPSQ